MDGRKGGGQGLSLFGCASDSGACEVKDGIDVVEGRRGHTDSPLTPDKLARCVLFVGRLRSEDDTDRLGSGRMALCIWGRKRNALASRCIHQGIRAWHPRNGFAIAKPPPLLAGPALARHWAAGSFGKSEHVGSGSKQWDELSLKRLSSSSESLVLAKILNAVRVACRRRPFR